MAPGRIKIVSSLAATLFLFAFLPGVPNTFAQENAGRVLVFVSDGMRQDFMKQFVKEGKLPAYDRLLRLGIDGGEGMIPPVPPLSGVAWTTLATGASPSVSGVTGNSFHDNTRPFTTDGISAWSAGANRAETIGAAADKAGLKVAVLGWQTFDRSAIKNGVVVEPGPRWLTARGIVVNYDVPLLYTDIREPLNPLLTLNKVELEEAKGWTNMPPSFSPARETAFSLRCIVCATPAVLNYSIWISDSSDDRVINYDQVLVSARKDGNAEVARLGAGQWSGNIRTTMQEQEGGFSLKIIDLEPDLSKFRLYFTPVTQIQASPSNLQDDLVQRFDAVMPDDFGPFVSGLIDAPTYIEQSMRHAQALADQIYPHVLRTVQPALVLAGLGVTDSVQHRMLAWALPGNELYDAINAPMYWKYIQQSYQAADSLLAALWAELPSANVFAASDHGMTVSGKVINANYLLEKTGLFDPRNLAASRAAAYGSGGLSMVHVNLAGRNPEGVVPLEDFDNVRRQIVDAFNALGPSVIEKVILKEESKAIETAGFTWNIQHPDRTGDVLVFARPPYQYAAPVAGRILADVPFMAGQHGYSPNGDPDRYAVFAAAGPKIPMGIKVDRPTALDLAPTIAFILGIDPPAQSDSERRIFKN